LDVKVGLTLKLRELNLVSGSFGGEPAVSHLRPHSAALSAQIALLRIPNILFAHDRFPKAAIVPVQIPFTPKFK
jgi:hypothetical protein